MKGEIYGDCFRGLEYDKVVMIMKKIVILIILVLIIVIGILFLKKDKRENIDIPILLYHDFVVRVPDEDPDDFNYINTPLSFEENIRTLRELKDDVNESYLKRQF